MAQKSIITVREATLMAYKGMAREFKMWQLTAQVKRITGREFLQDGTITRRLRELRTDGNINYVVINPGKSQYRKIDIDPANQAPAA